MAKIFAIILFLTTISSIRSQCNFYTANVYHKRSIYEFSLNLMKRVTEAQENHFVTSPFSAWSLLSSLSFAAEGETLAEMKQVLRLHPNKCFLNKYFDTVINIFRSDSEETTLEKSSALFIDENMSVKQSFLDEMTNIGIPDIVTKSFQNFEETAAMINDYVSKGTAGLITDVVTPEDIQSVYLIFVEALYFKAPWKIQFSESETETSAFYDDSGTTQIGDVNLMYVMDDFNITYIKPIGAEVLELPYGDNSRFSMLIFLPDSGVTIPKLIDSMKVISLRSIFGLYNSHGVRKAFVQIPRFKITTDLDNLKELLSDMGLRSMFEDSAQFPGISDYSLYISNLIQKATIEVNEQGSEASSATEAGLVAKSMPKEFIANKPFLWMIVDQHTEVPIFVGAYAKPTVY